jgi:undecaprenyl diphosphate synthase
MTTPPRHIAFIMDGNRRWAKSNMLPVVEGHRRGANTLKDIVKASAERGVEALSFYAFSTENWKRSDEEVMALMKLLRTFLKKEAKFFKENYLRFVHLGNSEDGMLPEDIVSSLAQMQAETSSNKGMSVCIAINYGGRYEILRAVKVSGGDADKFEASLDTAGLPDVDMLIRTSGEQRLSNFLLWQVAYAELFFTQKPWPAFKETDLDEILTAFKSRNRRFGGSNASA